MSDPERKRELRRLILAIRTASLEARPADHERLVRELAALLKQREGE